MDYLVKRMNLVMDHISFDINKNTKAAEARVRKNTLIFEKLGKQYRKDSIAQHK